MFQSSGEVQAGDGDLQGSLKLRAWTKPASVSSEERSRTDWGQAQVGGQCWLSGWLVAWGEGLGTFTWTRGGRLSDLSSNEGGAR